MHMIQKLIKIIKKQHRFNALNYSAQLSYGILLAFLPMMMVFYAASGFFFSEFSDEISSSLEIILPKGMLEFFSTSSATLENTDFMNGTWAEGNPFLYTWSLILIAFFIVYAAIRSVRAFMVTSTRVSGFKEKRNFFKLWQEAFYNAIVLAVLVFSVIYFYVVTQRQLSLIAEAASLNFLYRIWTVFSYFYLISMLVVIVTWCYCVFPTIRLKFRQALPGGIFAVGTWLIVIHLVTFLQDRGLWPVGLSELTLSVNMIVYIYLFCLILLSGSVVNITFAKLNPFHQKADKLLARESCYYPDTVIRKGPPVQKGIIDIKLLYQKYYPERTKKERIKAFIDNAIDSLTKTNFPGICTQLAFYMLCTFVPLVFFLIEFVSRFYIDSQESLLQALHIYLPNSSYEYLVSEMSEMVKYVENNQAFMGFSALVMASISMYSILAGINQTYGFDRYRYRRALWFRSMFFTLFLAMGTTVLMVLYSISESVRSWIHSLLIIGLPDAFSARLFAILFSEFVLFLFIMAIYVAAPEKPYRIRQVLPGTIFAVLAISIVFRIYMFFLNRSITYIALYGTQSGLFILLVVLFFFSCVLNIGAKINVIFGQKR